MDAILINKSDTSQSCSLSVSYADAMQNYERRGTFGIGAIEGGDSSERLEENAPGASPPFI